VKYIQPMYFSSRRPNFRIESFSGRWHVVSILIVLFPHHVIAFRSIDPALYRRTSISVQIKASSDGHISSDNKRPTTRKRKIQKGGAKISKPRSKAKNILSASNSKSASNELFIARQSTPPPLYVDYETNRLQNQEEQERRRIDQSIAADCQHFQTCSGCMVGKNVVRTNVVTAAQRYFANERYEATREYSAMDDIDSSYPVAIPSPVTGWRTQAKLAVSNKSSSSWKNTGCVFGLYEKGSHVVKAIPNCLVHHPSINAAVALLELATTKAGTMAYSEDSRDIGGLRYVQLQVERVTGKVCLTLIWNAASLKDCQPSLARLLKELTKQMDNTLWHSIWCHCNDSARNNIFSRSPGRWHRLSGPEFMREPIPVASDSTDDKEAAGWLYFSPLTFRQGNLDGFDILALDAARAVPSGAKVCELYAGVGVLGFTALAYHFFQSTGQPLQWLRCSDENPANARCFERTLDTLPIEMTGKTQVRQHSRQSSGRNDQKELTIGQLAQLMESGKSTQRNNDPKASYTVASAAKALRSGQALGATVLIVDPPRKGLEEEVLEELCKPVDPKQPYVESATLLTIPDERVNWVNDVETLIYVSCGFDALASDCDRLLSSRGAKWKLHSTTGYLLFPGSDHVETLAIFRRG
jgi:23S rRNA (uracil1939-C5)-methyltransferase